MNTKRNIRTAAAAITAAAAFAVPATAAEAATWFQTPSSNIICKATSTSMKCDVKSEDIGATVGLYGQTRWTSSRPQLDYGDHTLRYGQTVRLGSFACTSTTKGLRCWSRRSGNGFFLSTQRQFSF